MTEEEIRLMRLAFTPRRRRDVDDWLEIGTWLVGGVSAAYFGAHLLAALVGS